MNGAAKFKCTSFNPSSGNGKKNILLSHFDIILATFSTRDNLHCCYTALPQ